MQALDLHSFYAALLEGKKTNYYRFLNTFSRYYLGVINTGRFYSPFSISFYSDLAVICDIFHFKLALPIITFFINPPPTSLLYCFDIGVQSVVNIAFFVSQSVVFLSVLLFNTS